MRLVVATLVREIGDELGRSRVKNFDLTGGQDPLPLCQNWVPNLETVEHLESDDEFTMFSHHEHESFTLGRQAIKVGAGARHASDADNLGRLELVIVELSEGVLIEPRSDGQRPILAALTVRRRDRLPTVELRTLRRDGKDQRANFLGSVVVKRWADVAIHAQRDRDR